MAFITPETLTQSIIYDYSGLLGLRLCGEPKTGDVIIFRHEGKPLVKRIAATSGESVLHNGEVLIAPDSSYYVPGDNAENSPDSRYWEMPFVSGEDVLGKVMLLSSRP